MGYNFYLRISVYLVITYLTFCWKLYAETMLKYNYTLEKARKYIKKKF